MSETIKQIEDDVGVTLFDRSQRPLVVTEFGHYFVSDAIEILNRFDQSIRDMRDFGGKEKGLVRIASSPSVVSTLVIPALAEFRSHYPNIEIAIHQENAKNVSEQLRMGFVEIGIHESWIDSENLSCELLLTDTYGLVCSAEHPLASQQTVSFADLSHSTVIQLSDDSAIRKRLDAESQIKHFLRADIETSDATSLIWMISQNLGVSVLPENASMIPTNGSVCFLPIEGFEKIRNLYLISNKKRPVSPAAAAFMSIVRTVAQSHSKSVCNP
jgi:DNA-binding transcriptional LysR family regulator